MSKSRQEKESKSTLRWPNRPIYSQRPDEVISSFGLNQGSTELRNNHSVENGRCSDCSCLHLSTFRVPPTGHDLHSPNQISARAQKSILHNLKPLISPVMCVLFYVLLFTHPLDAAHRTPTDHLIYWNSSNPLFSSSINIFYVQEKDSIVFICPTNRNTDYDIYWSKQRPVFDKCSPQADPEAVQLFSCKNRPGSPFYLQVDRFSWVQNNPSFLENQPIYFIAQFKVCISLNVRLEVIMGHPKATPSVTTTTPNPPNSQDDAIQRDDNKDKSFQKQPNNQDEGRKKQTVYLKPTVNGKEGSSSKRYIVNHQAKLSGERWTPNWILLLLTSIVAHLMR